LDARLASRGLGIARFLTELAEGMSERVDVVWFGSPVTAPSSATDVVNVSRYPYPLLDGPVGRRLVARQGLDVMHFAGNTGWGSPGPVPSILTVHDLIFLKTSVQGRSLRQIVGHRYLRSTVGAAVRAATAVACPSRASAVEVQQTFGLSQLPHVIPLGVEPVPPLEREEPSYAVVFAARDPRKGVELAIEGWRAAQRTPGRLRVLAGAGLPDGFADLAGDDLRSGRIEVLDYLPRGELWKVLGGAAVLLHTSEAEGFGIPVLEAMAAGVPVISGLSVASREVGADAILTIDPADPVDSVRRHLIAVMEREEVRNRLVEAGRRRSLEFGWQRTADAYTELYAAALDLPVK
jgi:glycosyltransferase involved in cell wall biosynthesis